MAVDTLATLREMVERCDYEEAGLRGTISALPNNSLVSEWTYLAKAHMDEANALKRAIAIVELVPRIANFIQRVSIAEGVYRSPSLHSEAKELLTLLSPKEV